jgi:hypothetical protein
MPEVNYEEEIAAFLASHRRYIPTERNKLLLLEFLEDHDLELLSSNLAIAYTNLAAADKLDLEASEETTPPKPVGYRRREFVCYRNGRPLSGEVRSI